MTPKQHYGKHMPSIGKIDDDDDQDSQISEIHSDAEAELSSSGGSNNGPSAASNSGAGFSSDTSREDHELDNSTGNGSYELFGLTRFQFAAASKARWVFLASLMIAALGLATTVYFILDREQTKAFEAEFENLGLEVIGVGNQHVLSTLKIMNGVTTTVTSIIDTHNKANSSIYPSSFVTVPHMEQLFGSARNASGALVLAYVPLIQSNELKLWSEYSFEYQEWISDYNDDRLVEPILTDIWNFPEDSAAWLYFNECNQQHGGDLVIDDIVDRIAMTIADGPFSPVWTFSPAPDPTDTSIINHDLFGRIEFKQAVESINKTRQPMFLDVCNLASWFNIKDRPGNQEAVIAYPVFESFSPDADIVGHMVEIIPWAYFFEDILPEGTKPLQVVLESSCGQVATYEVRGRDVKFLGDKDVHSSKYTFLGLLDVFAEFANAPQLIKSGLEGVCVYTTTVYPTAEFEAEHKNNNPVYYALVVLAVFILVALLFFLFDVLMTRQRDQVMDTAKKQNAIVSSLFPKSIQAKMLQQIDSDNNKLSKIGKAGLKNFLFDHYTYGDSGTSVDTSKETTIKVSGPHRSKPIADLFPETTIMFGDIAGFTAWSSAREPSQVFTLLETIYHEFDTIAKRRRVFKVEVVGDCYVAVCGLPDPKPDHACVMAKFAIECVKAMNRLTQDLEVELGPDTGDLRLRVGLHSGPVVAGVLRGEKSRFQLFGDTMNTAARMESTGIPGMVQISQETADLLIAANKKHWIGQRRKKVSVKGKGELTTFFLKMGSERTVAARSVSLGTSPTDTTTGRLVPSIHSFLDDVELVERRNRIADWTVLTLAELLKEIEVRRQAVQTKMEDAAKMKRLESSCAVNEDGSTVISEVKEIIELPRFDVAAAEREAKIDASALTLKQEVLQELRDFVRTIALMYHDNPFHNFQHANHVTMSVVKLLGRIVAPDVTEVKTTLHDHTYGITSDPLTRFAVVFSALIHDVDHPGVSNAQLVKEGDPVAQLYNSKSVAEQNSIDVAWDLLMESRFENLRRQIYTTEAEFKRFRQMVVNAVLATDIMDKDLKELRNKRWATAFSDETPQQDDGREAVNRKATTVIEHLIQASDVAHTMQHWHIYRKWNERLFQEMYKAWQEGRMPEDPSIGWYKGECGFFDFYIIPLAKKLKECGVFGVSSDEYLSYALQNRKEWESRGQTIVKDMVRALKRLPVAKPLFATASGKESTEDTEETLSTSWQDGTSSDESDVEEK